LLDPERATLMKRLSAYFAGVAAAVGSFAGSLRRPVIHPLKKENLELFGGAVLASALSGANTDPAGHAGVYAAYLLLQISDSCAQEPEAASRVLLEAINTARGAGESCSRLIEQTRLNGLWLEVQKNPARIHGTQLFSLQSLCATRAAAAGIEATDFQLPSIPKGCAEPPLRRPEQDPDFQRLIRDLSAALGGAPTSTWPPAEAVAVRPPAAVTAHVRAAVRSGGSEPVVVDVDVPEAAWGPVADGSQQRMLRNATSDVAASIHRLVGEPWRPRFAFDDARAAASSQALFPDRESMPRGDIWFLGDIHGDLLALECALSHIERHGGEQVGAIVFLGDLIDDGGMALEVVVRVLKLMIEMPGRICLLAGNHDEALRYNETDRTFSSSVDPSEFASFLNSHAEQPEVVAIGRAFISMVAMSPRALFLPDGLIVAHGGVPQRDLWPSLTDRLAFGLPQPARDFVWTRPHPRAQKRDVDRANHGVEIGRIDFEEFCVHASTVTDRPVLRMVRGHDHVPERWDAYVNYKINRILTINTLSRRLDREFDGPPVRTPCIARWADGELPEVHRLRIPEHVALAVFPGLVTPAS
jgi:hypothetical protein